MSTTYDAPGSSDSHPFSDTGWPWVLFARLFLGAWWIVEATIGRFWKWGWFGSGVNPDWLGDTAGATIVSTAERASDDGVWAWYGWILDEVAIPNAEFLAWFTSISQVLIGVALIVGLFTRAAALSGIAMLCSILLMGSFRTSPLLIALSLFVLLVGAERYWSLDRRLLDKSPRLRSVVTLNLEQLATRIGPVIAVAASALGSYFLLQVATRPAPRFVYVGQEFAVFLFAIAAAVVLIGRFGLPRWTVAIGMLRMYLGFKLLWWIWTAPQAALTSMPGFVDAAELETVLSDGVASQLPLLDSIIDAVFVPTTGFWVVTFGLIQIAVGFALLLGWRSREANWAAIGLLGVYVLLGFTRYAPYLLGFAVITLGLGSAPRISLVSLLLNRRIEARPAPSPLRFGPRAPLIVSAVAAVLISAAVASGIEPNGYNSDVGSTILWTLGLNAVLLAATAWRAQTSSEGLETIDLTATARTGNGRERTMA